MGKTIGDWQLNLSEKYESPIKNLTSSNSEIEKPTRKNSEIEDQTIKNSKAQTKNEFYCPKKNSLSRITSKNWSKSKSSDKLMKSTKESKNSSHIFYTRNENMQEHGMDSVSDEFNMLGSDDKMYMQAHFEFEQEMDDIEKELGLRKSNKNCE